MLTRLTRRLRLRAAMALAVLYAVCAVAPSVAMALAGGAAAAHCLTDDHHGVARGQGHDHIQGEMHDHGDGTAHDHAGAPPADDDRQQDPGGSCCGLFCFSAATGDVDAFVEGPVHASRVLPVLDLSRDGRGPDRINRPPISLLPL
jgi:hypothetical protein